MVVTVAGQERRSGRLVLLSLYPCHHSSPGPNVPAVPRWACWGSRGEYSRDSGRGGAVSTGGIWDISPAASSSMENRAACFLWLCRDEMDHALPVAFFFLCDIGLKIGITTGVPVAARYYHRGRPSAWQQFHAYRSRKRTKMTLQEDHGSGPLFLCAYLYDKYSGPNTHRKAALPAHRAGHEPIDCQIIMTRATKGGVKAALLACLPQTGRGSGGVHSCG